MKNDENNGKWWTNIEKMMKKYKNIEKIFKIYKKEGNPKELPKLTPVAPESKSTDPSPDSKNKSDSVWSHSDVPI